MIQSYMEKYRKQRDREGNKCRRKNCTGRYQACHESLLSDIFNEVTHFVKCDKCGSKIVRMVKR